MAGDRSVGEPTIAGVRVLVLGLFTTNDGTIWGTTERRTRDSSDSINPDRETSPIRERLTQRGGRRRFGMLILTVRETDNTSDRQSQDG
jgi:hypothetical protein